MGELFSFYYLAPDRQHSSFDTAALCSEKIQLVEIIHDMLSKRCIILASVVLLCSTIHNYARLDAILSSLMSTATMSQYAR